MELPFKKRSPGLFILKIDLPALLAFALFAGLIFFYLIPGFEKVMMDRKRSMIHEMTSSANSILEYYNLLSKEGTISIDDAKEQARSAISSIRYGETLKDYFWITDTIPRMIEHPYRPDLNGTDLSDFHDSKGKLIFVEFVKAVTPTGESYVDYMWQWNDDSTKVVPKLSYVRLYKPWGWIIGTGIYIEDVRSEIHRLESRALIVSVTIAIIIITLLIAISRQGHRIEQKRGFAEEELRKSKELYRALAEAASEGVMIWSESGLQANKTLLSWLGYSEDELLEANLSDILSSTESLEITDPGQLYEELSIGLYIECVLKDRDGSHFKSHVDLSRIIMGETKAVLLVIRPVKAETSPSSFSVPSTLLENVSTGFFRTIYGRKNRFLSATGPAIKILGFNSSQELVHHTLESFFVNSVQLTAFRRALANKEEIFRREVLLKRQNGENFWALISIMIVELNLQEIWCEGVIELLAVSDSGQNRPFVNLSVYSASYIMDVPVSSIMQSPVFCFENMVVTDALALMKDKNTQVIIVTDKNRELMGIIDSGTIGIRLAEGISKGTEVFNLMINPPDFIKYSSKVSEAFKMISNSQKKCLIVSSEKNKVEGIITHSDLSGAFFSAPELIVEEIAEAKSASSLRDIYIKFRKIAISMIIGHADPYSISLYISNIADIICQRVLSLCIEESGTPPCRFSFIQTGSAGRMEQSLFTDQDNAIIFENIPDENISQTTSYFVSLGRKVNEMLEVIGYRLCRGENMAGNPRWCQPVNTWKKYFSEWIQAPGPEELLEVSIFFDFRFCFGDSSLYAELRDYVRDDLKTNDIFFHHMASSLKPFNPSLSDLNNSKTDIKRILIALTGIIRLYALKFGISEYSTIERIIHIYSEEKLNYNLFRESIRAWKDLTSLRILHQANCINKGIEPDNMVNFRLVQSDVACYAEQAVKTIRNLMLMTENDFYTSTG